MRALVVIALLVAAAGCSDEPSFDERYDKAAKQLRNKAAEIDRELQRPAENEPAAPSS